MDVLFCRAYCRASVRVAYKLPPLQTVHQYHGEAVDHVKLEEYDINIMIIVYMKN